MRNVNLLAAGGIGAILLGLAVAPLTRDHLRVDLRSVALGRPVGRALVALGYDPSDVPEVGLAPTLPPEPVATDFPSRLARATAQPADLPRLVADFPDQPAAHAALTRNVFRTPFLVRIGRKDEVQAAMPSKRYQPDTHAPTKPADLALLLKAATDGERLDPDNAYFSAMAAVGFYAAKRDDDAHTALARAARKTAWREYTEVESSSAIDRYWRRDGVQNTLCETAIQSAIPFPHYAALREMARLTVAQAIQAERKGDDATALALRTDVGKFGARMRRDSAPIIGSLVGGSITAIAGMRPDGVVAAPGIEDDDARRRAAEAAFVAYLKRHGTPALADAWVRDVAAAREVREISRSGMDVAATGLPALVTTQMRLFANLALFGNAAFLCALAALAFAAPSLRRRIGRGARPVIALAFGALLLWFGWSAAANALDLRALARLTEGLTLAEDGDARSVVAPVLAEGALAFGALATVALLGVVVLIASAAGKQSTAALLRRWALPTAAALTVVYALHVVAFCRRETILRGELAQMRVHEGRYLAAKLGKAWPD